MDRRAFLTGAGTLGAVASGGWATLDSHGASVRADGLAKAARGGGTTPPVTPRPPGTTPPKTVNGMVLGYLAGSAGLLAVAAKDSPIDRYARKLAWGAWTTPAASVLPRGILARETMVSVSLGSLQRAHSPANLELLQGIDVTAHFAIAGGQFVPFYAWKYTTASYALQAKSSAPLTFDGYVPDRLALQVDFTLDTGRIARNVQSTGMVYLPIGSRDGPGNGLYVLAGPSHVSGGQPDLASHVFSGDLDAPVMHVSGSKPTFDYLTLTIQPKTA